MSGSKCTKDKHLTLCLVKRLYGEDTSVAIAGSIGVEEYVVTCCCVNHGNAVFLKDIDVSSNCIGTVVTYNCEDLILVDKLFHKGNCLSRITHIVIVLKSNGLAVEATLSIVSFESCLNTKVEGNTDSSAGTGSSCGVTYVDNVALINLVADTATGVVIAATKVTRNDAEAKNRNKHKCKCL